MYGENQTPVLERLVERVWLEATNALAASLIAETNQTAQQLIEAVIHRIVERAANDEVLEILGELLPISEKVFFASVPFQYQVLSGSSPAEVVRGLVRSFLTTAAIMHALEAGELNTRAAESSKSLKAVRSVPDSLQVEIEREFLQLVLKGWPALIDELGERTRDLLAHCYNVPIAVTQPPFAPDLLGDASKIRLTFERLLWAFYLTQGFTRSTTKWMGKPMKTGEALTSTRHYMTSSVRSEFLKMIIREEPELISTLTKNQLAALSRKYSFMGTHAWEGRESYHSGSIVRQAFLRLLWGYYKSHKAHQ